jgi:hypothetical protein
MKFRVHGVFTGYVEVDIDTDGLDKDSIKGRAADALGLGTDKHYNIVGEWKQIYKIEKVDDSEDSKKVDDDEKVDYDKYPSWRFYSPKIILDKRATGCILV